MEPAVTIDDDNLRWKALSSVLQAVMRVPGPVTATAVVEHVIAAARLPEEQCAGEAYAAIALLIRSGLVTSNTGDATQSTIAAATTLTASPSLIGYTWAESVVDNHPA